MLLNFSQITPGRYVARVAYGEMRTGKRGPYLLLEFEVEGGNEDGVVLTRAFSFSPAARMISKRQLEAVLGEPLEDVIDSDELIDRLIDRRCLIEVEEEAYAGDVRPVISNVIAAE